MVYNGNMDKNELNTIKLNRIISVLSIALFAGLIFLLVFFRDKNLNPALYSLKCVGIFFLYFFLSIVMHEFGHFIFGLIDGFKPSSFQVLFFKFFYDEKDKPHLKFSKMPFLGQCTMYFKNDIRKQKYKLYMYGGSIMNLFLALTGLILYLILGLSLNAFLPSLIILYFINIYLFMSNGIPLNLNNVYNDCLNLKLMNKYIEIRYCVLSSLHLEREKELGLSIKEMSDEHIDNHLRSVPYFNTLGFPLVLYKTMREFDRHNENPLKFIMHQYERREYLPRIYNYSLIALVLLYDIINDIPYMWILKAKEFEPIFKKVDMKDPINLINFTLMDCKSKKTAPDVALNIIDKEIDAVKCDKDLSSVEKEFYINLILYSAEYIRNREKKKEMNLIENRSQSQY